MPNRTLFVDMDGTIAVWRTAVTIEELFEKDYFRRLGCYDNVINAIKLLHDDYNVQLCVLSAYLEDSEYAVKEKNEWLDTHAPFIDKRLFCPTHRSKFEVVKEVYGAFDKRSVILDDYSKNLHEWTGAGGTGIKLLNGVNGTNGTWTGPSVNRFYSPNSIARSILEVLETI